MWSGLGVTYGDKDEQGKKMTGAHGYFYHATLQCVQTNEG